MRTAFFGLAAMPLVLGACGAMPAMSGARPMMSVGGGDIALPVQSVEDRRFATVVRQAYDFSCGSAALATLLQYHYGSPHTEETVFRGMWAEGDRAQIRRLGFSLLDMKRFLAARGLNADGYQVTLEQIAEARVPGIALVNINNYRHFVVVKGLAGGQILVGDPSLGLRSMPVAEFSRAWNGVFFIIDPAGSRTRGRFNAADQWAAYPGAPLGSRFADPVSQQALALTAPFYREF